ncbi:hypothetical protein AA0111_g5329 [Alternaria arborescens]|uniref:hypothetical protein n=1 Tax=Alternaria arborescens TaxID=156630 RepID=UPI001074BCA2|nr:hypothetical protein AA0111_g5329 [Alternaria arborescens]RYO30883.1 hypothetical protein AA0111_g5329 [Alternaria arborescens]
MATNTDHALLEAIVALIWACLLVPAPGKNGLFADFFFDKAVLLNIAASASLSFCPGLLEAAQAATPPSLDFFRNTSSDGVGRWGVYCLVLEKPGHIPLVYIGSGTKAKTGLRARWQQYEQLKYLNLWPRWVLKAHRDGYRIVHKGWLVSAPIPVAVNVPAFRLLFIAMEATFAFLLWTMKSSTKDYHMGSCCPWPRQKGLFGYGGLCNHNPLTESVVGNFDLTAQQLTALDVANRERRNALSVDYRVKAMATDPARRLGLERETFTTVADNQQTVQFPVFQGERVNCEDNTSLGEFTLAPIPPMRAGEAVLEVVFEVDVNGILKVTATEKTSGRSANITISNAVGKLSSADIENMINDAQKFKSSDEAFSKKFESRQQLESYISRVEEMISDPTTSIRLKRGQKEKIESALSDAMAQLEVEDAPADDLKKKELALKRTVTKAFSTR